MIVLFGLPIFLAYGVVHHAGPAFYLAALAVLPPFLVLPCALGVAITMVLVRVFPARRTKDILLLLSVVAVALLYVFLRFLQPERLVKPEAFADFLQFLAAMQAPASPYLPSTWAADDADSVLRAAPGPATPRFSTLALATSTAAAAFVGCAIVGRANLRDRLVARAGGPPGARHPASVLGSAVRAAADLGAGARPRAQGREDVLPRHDAVVAAHPARRAGRRLHLQLPRAAPRRAPSWHSSTSSTRSRS